ncbi:MAG TPA: HAD-IA family hydrolase [Candidatus Binatia bacterium]|nr:HAD-IA family hydrolase [Candidatus Binatia bacterium]
MNPPDEERLGKRLQAARQAAGLTQQVLCQRANLSYSTLTKIERGAIKSPSIFTIQSIANVLGVTLDELIGNPKSSPSIQPKKRMRSKSGVGFVYFDINGCLVQFYHRALTQLAHDSGKSPDIVESVFWHNNDAICRGEITMAEFNGALAERLGLPSVDWFSYYLAAVEPMPEMHELVNWANERYGVGLLTNIMPGLVKVMLERGLLPNIAYDTIVDSSEVHTIKPEAKIYEIAGERANQAPEEILLVDDSRANLMAAERFGWHVMWFDDYRSDESAERIKQALEPAVAVESVTSEAAPDQPAPALSESAW